jgi:hypothetical protein
VKQFLAISLSVLILGSGGCALISAPASPTPASPTEWKQINFAEWNSGMYAKDYFGKWAVADGFFQPTPINSIMNSDVFTFYIADKLNTAGPEMMKPGYTPPVMLVAQAPLSMRDQLIQLKPGQPISVRGRVENVYQKSIFTGQTVTSSLYINVKQIESR